MAIRFGVFAVAQAPTGSTLAEAMYTTKAPLPLPGSEPRFSGLADKPVAGANRITRCTSITTTKERWRSQLALGSEYLRAVGLFRSGAAGVMRLTIV